jgi:CRISPR-associated protein Cmr6
MPTGVVELRDVRDGNRTVKKPFISGTEFEVTPDGLRKSGWGALSMAEVAKDLDIEYDVKANTACDIRRYAAVPVGIRRLLETHGCDHPGIALDKFIYRSADQSFVKHALQKVVEINNATNDQSFQELRERWMALINPEGKPPLRCITTGSLTLHLARASALENAGLCLHPIYGFAYIPGSGLKGMARAYAETVWLPAQPDKPRAWRHIEDVFGWTPNLDRRQQINNPDHPAEPRRTDDNDPDSPEIKASSGDIVFHDAWPETWPKLVVDIVNNHHPHYYTGQAAKRDKQGLCDDCKFPPDDVNAHPPGDWENPVPVYFLAVQPGTTFTFALTKRRTDVPDHLVKLAQEWLLGALCHLGAGAKTNAGYGAFKPVEQQCPALPPGQREILETTLELVTPAFLAGANQQAEDCDLRPATLRGLLRWWWRTLHAGFLDVKTLRSLEVAIWGDTKGSGAVRMVLEPINTIRPQPYDKRSKAKSDDNHKKSPYGIPSEANSRKTTPGLWYVSYGMDETNRRRHYLEPATRWRLRMCARPTRFFASRTDANDPKKINHGREITAAQVLEQVQAALWLLCSCGGVGSKGRKGFGSLSTDRLPDKVVAASKACAQRLRQQVGLPNTFDERHAESPSLTQMLGPIEVTFPWPNVSSVWSVLDQVGYAYQTFAKKYKHTRQKSALGLPRRIGQPAQGTFNPTPPVTHNSRHASPVHIHIQRESNGYLVRVVAFPAAHLPDLQTSRAFLNEFLRDFGDDLQRRARLSPPSTPSGGTGPGQPSSSQSSGSSVGPTPVRVKFLGPHEALKTPQQAFWVQEEGKRRGLLKYGQIPSPLPAIGSEIDVYRTSNNPNSPEYRWDLPPSPGPPRRGPGGRRPSGRR